jgi:protein-S-isoprenylcysteine O-methyltransferase
MLTGAQAMQITRPCLVVGVVVVDGILLWRLPGPWNYFWLFAVGCWAVLNLYWAWLARETRPVSGRWSGLLWAISAAEFLLIALPLSSVPILGMRFIPRLLAVEIMGAAMCAFGVGFAIWSRRVLAQSWSNIATLRDGHRLVQHGPYAIVRHPIYFGFLTFAAGMIIVLGEVRALVLVADIIVCFRKIKSEESILRSTYPDDYPQYEQRVKKLLPYVW